MRHMLYWALVLDKRAVSTIIDIGFNHSIFYPHFYQGLEKVEFEYKKLKTEIGKIDHKIQLCASENENRAKVASVHQGEIGEVEDSVRVDL